MLKTGDIIYKVTLEGYDVPCVVVKKYKVGQRLSKIDGTEGGGYLLKLAVRADQYLYLGDYIEDSEQMVNPNNEAFHTCELSFYHWLQREYKPGYFENQ